MFQNSSWLNSHIRRDAELASIGGLPVGVKDVWVEMGYKKEYTLDLQRISNL